MVNRACCSSCLRVLRYRPSEVGVVSWRRTSMQIQQRNLATTRTSKTGAKSSKAHVSPKVIQQRQPAQKTPAPKTTPGNASVSNAQKTAPAEAPSETAGMIDTLASQLKKKAPSLTEPYTAYSICKQLVQECSRVGDYKMQQREKDSSAEVPLKPNGEEIGVGTGWWYDKFGLTPTFNTWAQITLLHMYLLTVRIRAFPPDHFPTWSQQLTDHFFYIAEHRITTYHAIHSSMMRNKYLKDLFEQYRGLTLAYDEGLVKGDAVLASAIWRNVCKGEDTVDLKGLAQIVSYMRSVSNKLEEMNDQAIVNGDVVFGDPGEEESWVKVKSRALDPETLKPLTREVPNAQVVSGKTKGKT